MLPQTPSSVPSRQTRTNTFGRTVAACVLLLAVAGTAVQAQTTVADVQYAKFLKGLTATEIVRSNMASTPKPRIIAVLAAISEVGARNKNMTAAQLSAFVTAYNTQLRAVYSGDTDLAGSFAVQPAVRYLTRVTSVPGLDTDVGDVVAFVLGLDVGNPNRQLNLSAFQTGTIARLATSDAVALLLQDIFGSRDLSGATNPLVEAQAAAFLRSEGIEPYPTASVLSSQYPEVVAGLALMPATAAAFEVERAANFPNLRQRTLDEFATVSGFINTKITNLNTLAAQYNTLAATETAALNPATLAADDALRIQDLYALNQSRAKSSFATAALAQGSFDQQTEANTLRTYANIQIKVASDGGSKLTRGLKLGGSLLTNLTTAFLAPDKVSGSLLAIGALAQGTGEAMELANERPAGNPYQQLSNQITVLQNQVEGIRVQMNTRFDRIDSGIQTIYTTMDSGFNAMTQYFQGQAVSLRTIQNELAITQSNLSRFEANLYGILAAGFNFSFVANMETALGYRDRLGTDLTLNQYGVYEGAFYSAAVNDSATNVFAGPDVLTYDTAGTTQLDNQPLGYNINALRTFPSTALGQATLGGSRVPNPTSWSLNADAYSQFARENPWYNAKVLTSTSARLGTVLTSGQASQSVASAARRQALFDRLISDHAARTTALQTALDNYKTQFLNARALGSLNLWGGPSQLGLPLPSFTERMGPYYFNASTAVTSTNCLDVPRGGNGAAWTLMPGELQTAMYLNLPSRGPGAYSWIWREQFEVNDTGTWRNNSNRTATYEVQLSWNPNRNNAISVSGVSQTVVCQNTDNFFNVTTFIGRTFLLRANTSDQSTSRAYFRDLWNGVGAGAGISMRDQFFNASSSTTANGGPRWSASTRTLSATDDQINAVRPQVNTKLRDLQLELYQTIQSGLSSNDSATAAIRTAADNLGNTTKLLEAYIALGMPESLGTSELLRGPLRGTGEAINRAAISQFYSAAIAALPTGSNVTAPTAEPRLDAAFSSRRGVFQRELNRALTPGRAAEYYPFMKWSLAGLTNLQSHGLRLAADDIYITAPNTPLVVSTADGLLSNDAEQPSASIIAVLISPPASGTLVLNGDSRGGFRFTPAANFTGSVSFTYKARANIDPTNANANIVESLPATVVIRVEACLPSITQNPAAAPLTVGTTASFAVTATAATRASYQWRKNGVVIIGNDRIRGTTTPVLAISNTSAADQAVYTVAITTDCGTVLSAGASLGSVACSIADLAIAGQPADGIVDGSDFIAFINSFGIGDASIDNLADINGDRIIDGSDFIDFINAFAAGC